jgi:hypothetical protein
MSSKPSPEQLIACVEQSPAAVAVHDRAAWVGLYATDGEVNDPVGSRPHAGADAIGRFYDTFIAPNTIVFHVQKDIACGMTVMRDLSIDTTLSTGARVNVPMHLDYQLVEEAGRLKIRRLHARWELAPMILQLLQTGIRGIWTTLKLGPQVLAHQGIGGMLGFMKGFIGVGGTGKRAVRRLAEALQRGDEAAVREALEFAAPLELPAGTRIPIEPFCRRLRDMRWSKLIAAGHTVSATVMSDDVSDRGVVLCHFTRRGGRIAAVQAFLRP